MNNYEIELKTKELRAHLLITSKDVARYYLNGINIKSLDNFRYRLASTDGHRLLVTYPMITEKTMQEHTGQDQLDITILNDDIKRIVTGNKNEFVILKIENDRYYLDQLEITPIDGEFPEIKRVIPDYEAYETNNRPVIQSHFNFSYLNDAAKVSKLLDNNAMPILYPNKKQNDPAIIGYDNGFMVLMPVRNSANKDKRDKLKDNLDLLINSNTSKKEAA